MKKTTHTHTYGITSSMLKSANLSQKAFLQIMLDYERIKGDIEHELGRLFWEFSRVQDDIGINSIKARAKDPSHLAEKIIRKRKENKRKKRNPWVRLNADNYRQVVTDLGGLRTIMLFKENWPAVHQHIIDKYGHRLKEDPVYNAPEHLDFPFQESYINNPISEGSKFKLRHVKTKNGYASTHYVIKSECVEGVYFEIQTRTAAEDLFGEISHKVRYPHYQDDVEITESTVMLSTKISSVEEHISSMYELHSSKNMDDEAGVRGEIIQQLDKTSNQEANNSKQKVSSWDISAIREQFLRHDKMLARTIASASAIPKLESQLQAVLNSAKLSGVSQLGAVAKAMQSSAIQDIIKANTKLMTQPEVASILQNAMRNEQSIAQFYNYNSPNIDKIGTTINEFQRTFKEQEALRKQFLDSMSVFNRFKLEEYD